MQMRRNHLLCRYPRSSNTRFGSSVASTSTLEPQRNYRVFVDFYSQSYYELGCLAALVEPWLNMCELRSLAGVHEQEASTAGLDDIISAPPWEIQVTGSSQKMAKVLKMLTAHEEETPESSRRRLQARRAHRRLEIGRKALISMVNGVLALDTREVQLASESCEVHGTGRRGRIADKVIEEIRSLQSEARLLLAGRMLSKVDKYLESGVEANRKEVKAAVHLLSDTFQDSMSKLRHRASECSSTLQEWHSSDWLVAQTFMGITTSYKLDSDGSLWVRLQGTMEGVRLIDQLATVREVDLYKHWIPFCDKSSFLKRIDVVEILAYFNISLPGLSRDCVLHAYGCDAVLEEKCILIQGRSVEQWEGVEVPKAQGWRHGRLDVRAFKAKIEILSPTSASTSIMSNVDPRAPLPRSLINFVVRKLAGMLLYYLQQAAQRITAEEQNLHRKRIAEDLEFYQHWLYPRIQRFYATMGWTADGGYSWEPPPVASESDTSGGASDEPLPERLGCRSYFWRIAGRSPIRRAFGRQQRRVNGPDREPVANTLAPQVETLDIDPQLLEKWRSRRDSRFKNGSMPRAAFLRVVLYLGFAMLAALGQTLCTWLARQHCAQFRPRVIFVGFATFSLYVTGSPRLAVSY